MEQRIPWDDIYQRLESVKTNLEEIISSYSKLSKIIMRERQAIKSYNIIHVEESSLEKKEVSALVDAKLEVMKEHCKEIYNLYKKFVRDSSLTHKNFSLSNVEKLVDGLKAAEPKKLSSARLDKLMNDLNFLIKKFIKTVEVLQPKIDANNIALQKLLQSYRASHKFWQDMVHIESSSYDAQGLRGNKNTPLPSSIEIKA